MVDAIVSLTVERIADLLIQEADFLRSVRPELIRLQEELKRMQCFLKDADRWQDQDARVRNWIYEIRGLAYDSEDIIDTFIFKVATSRGGACRPINKSTSIFTKLPDLRHIGNQIESIRTKIADITASMQTYGIKFDAETHGETQRRLRRAYPRDEEEHVISFDAITKDLQAQLMAEEERVRVVSIVGMGGLGKTTLAKKVYNDIHVKKHFDYHSWAFISQQFSPKDVLIGVLMEVLSPGDKSKLKEEMASELKEKMKEDLVFRSLLEKMTEEEVVNMLYDILKEKRYVVVLDDIWSIEAWDSLKHAFPNGGKGSKVLFTTRIRDVASYADPWSTPIEPPFLNEDQGWELLSKKAFPKDVAIDHEYEKLGREMLKQCGGLPLAVAVLGGLLATKNPVKEWKVVQRNINAQFAKLEENHHQYGGVYGILSLSYHNLPFHLKPCFLYLSQFPEDWPIKKKRLIRTWIAEGFISQPMEGGDETMEDRAEQYLEELVSRSMIQVRQKDHTGSGIKICHIHDLVREMCISKAKDENFLGVVEHRERTAATGTCFSTVTNYSRRVAFHSFSSGNDRSMQFYQMPLIKRGDFQLRSLFYFVEMYKYRMKKQQVIYIFKNFRLLRVLNIENVRLYWGSVPSELGNLIHLRYLGLRGVGLRHLGFSVPVLPSSIGKLRWLFTLDLRYNHLTIRLPNIVWKLEHLRHLLVDRYAQGLHRLDRLRNLETLKWVKAKYLIRKDAVMQMTNLRNLAVYFDTKEELEVVLKSPSFAFGRLHSLKMMVLSYEIAFPNLEALSGFKYLTRAYLIGRISEDGGSLSHSLEFLPASLTKLILHTSQLKQDPMVILEKLPNLRSLSLEFDAYRGSEMVCSANGFSKLEILQLLGLKRLEEWRVEEGAMPCLETLELKRLEKLRMIPEGLKFVTTLQELKFIEMDRFKERVEVIGGVKGEDFGKVQHIPSISFHEAEDTGFWFFGIH